MVIGIRFLVMLLGLTLAADSVAASRFQHSSSELLCRNVSLFKGSSRAELQKEFERRDIHCSESGDVLPGIGESIVEPDPGPFVRAIEEESYEPEWLRQFEPERLCNFRYTPNLIAELARRHYECVVWYEGRRGGPYKARQLGSTAKNPSPVDAPDRFDTDVLCDWHRTYPKKHQIIDALRNRSDFTSREVDLIAERKVSMQMSEQALLCSWGQPKDINRTVGSWGVHKQYVYYSAYVYLENGIVTSWQD